MIKRVFIVHGWGDYPQNDWLPWLKNELEKENFEVQLPVMPSSNNPIIKDWVNHLVSVVGAPDEQTFFVGHSIGCQTILRYLETLNTPVGGAVFVAGWFTLSDLETEEEKIIGKPWIETPINFEKVKQACHHMTAIFGDDDPVVPFEPNRTIFQEKLGARIVVEHGKGHFSGTDGIVALPSALRAVLDINKGA